MAFRRVLLLVSLLLEFRFDLLSVRSLLLEAS